MTEVASQNTIEVKATEVASAKTAAAEFWKELTTPFPSQNADGTTTHQFVGPASHCYHLALGGCHTRQGLRVDIDDGKTGHSIHCSFAGETMNEGAEFINELRRLFIEAGHTIADEHPALTKIEIVPKV